MFKGPRPGERGNDFLITCIKVGLLLGNVSQMSGVAHEPFVVEAMVIQCAHLSSIKIIADSYQYESLHKSVSIDKTLKVCVRSFFLMIGITKLYIFRAKTDMICTCIPKPSNHSNYMYVT